MQPRIAPLRDDSEAMEDGLRDRARSWSSPLAAIVGDRHARRLRARLRADRPGGLALATAATARPARSRRAPRAAAEREGRSARCWRRATPARARRGEAPLDVEAELARCCARQIDAGLAREIRDLVIARNARRARRGEAPLDVEAEVARQISELD